MSDPALTGQTVVEKAEDGGFWNVDPALAKGAVTSAANLIISVLILFGVMTEDQREPIVAALTSTVAGVLAFLVIVVPVLQAAWTRLSVWSPRSAALLALVNARRGYEAAQEGKRPEPTIDAEVLAIK